MREKEIKRKERRGGEEGGRKGEGEEGRRHLNIPPLPSPSQQKQGILLLGFVIIAPLRVESAAYSLTSQIFMLFPSLKMVASTPERVGHQSICWIALAFVLIVSVYACQLISTSLSEGGERERGILDLPIYVNPKFLQCHPQRKWQACCSRKSRNRRRSPLLCEP